MPHRGHAMWRYVRFWRRDPLADAIDELDFHFDMLVSEYVRRGMPIDDARRAAQMRLGDSARASTECAVIDAADASRHDRVRLLKDVTRDARFSIRVLRREWRTTVIAIAC